jgi:hypothetical protein
MGWCCFCLQGLQPEVRTYNTAIIACNMCGQPQEAIKVGEPEAAGCAYRREQGGLGVPAAGCRCHPPSWGCCS